MRKTQRDRQNFNLFISQEIRKSIKQFPTIIVNKTARNGHCNY